MTTNHTRMPAATGGSEFYAKENNIDIVTDGDSWHPIIVAAGKEFTRLTVQCQTAVPTFDVDSDLTSFRLSRSASGPGLQVDKLGITLPIAFAAKNSDTTVLYIKAPSGFKILCSMIS